MAKIAHHGYLAVGAAAIVAAVAGCGAVLRAPAHDLAAGAPVTLTEQAAPSLLVVVAGPSGAGRLIGRVVTATARPREDLDVLKVDGRGRVVVASGSPPPATVSVPGKPAPPGAGASTYQWAGYKKALANWRSQVTAGKHTVAVRTKAATASWADRLRLRIAGTASATSPEAASLPEECVLAANATTNLVGQAGSHFGTRRVVLLAVASLSGMPPAGQLDGDDVIVVTASYLPTAAVVSAAQVNLMAAGAARAAVVGPATTVGQLDKLVTDGLSQHAVAEVLSGRALFANNGSALLPKAASILAPLVPRLRCPGATGIVNGYASAPGSVRHNQVLSQDRAAAVASFLEAHSVPKTHLLFFGHGAADLVAPGPSSDNRRVVVVLEEPAGRSC